MEEIEDSDYSEEYEDWVTGSGYHLVSRSFCDKLELVGFMYQIACRSMSMPITTGLQGR